MGNSPWKRDGCSVTDQAIVSDLIRIGHADGHYDEREQHWAKTLAEQLGVSAS